MLTIYILSAVLAVSISINIVLLTKKKEIKGRSESIELKEFLSDLASGGSMIAVRRMDPNDFLLRTPKK